MGIENPYSPAKVWRMGSERLKFTGSNCQSCNNLHFPARPICPDCGHNNNNKPANKDAPTSSSIVEGQGSQADVKP